MKKFYSVLVALFLVHGATAQSNQPCLSCLPEGITFSTQAQIDNFQANYPNCTQIEGDVTICGNDISNLNGLNVLNAFGGNLVIYSTSLINLIGLEGLLSIAGDFQIGYLNWVWVGNNLLTNFAGIGALTSIGGNLYICGNPILSNLYGLNSLTSIGGILQLNSDSSLTNLSGLDNLTSIGDNLIISEMIH